MFSDAFKLRVCLFVGVEMQCECVPPLAPRKVSVLQSNRNLPDVLQLTLPSNLSIRF